MSQIHYERAQLSLGMGLARAIECVLKALILEISTFDYSMPSYFLFKYTIFY